MIRHMHPQTSLLRFLMWLGGFYAFYAALMSALAHPTLYQFSPEPFTDSRFEITNVAADDGTSLPVRVLDVGDGSPTVLAFVGNVGSRAYFSSLYEPLIQAGATVIAMPYRGAEGVPGWPRERRLRSDADAVMNAMPVILGRDPGRVHLAGYSLGSGLALGLSMAPGAGDVLLLAPYARICEVMTQKSFLPACQMPWVDHWDNMAIAANPGPGVTIIHGVEDTLIPISQSEKLAAALGQSGRLDANIQIQGAGHNDLLSSPEAWDAITSWVAGASYSR